MMEITDSYLISIDDVFQTRNIELALGQLESKHDSCGIDGIKLSQLRDYWNSNRESLIADIKEGKYIPGVSSLVEILKSNGKKRIIAKLNSVDRLILRAIEQVVAPLSEKIFDNKEKFEGIEDLPKISYSCTKVRFCRRDHCS